jgi:hypothetical protein
VLSQGSDSRSPSVLYFSGLHVSLSTAGKPPSSKAHGVPWLRPGDSAWMGLVETLGWREFWTLVCLNSQDVHNGLLSPSGICTAEQQWDKSPQRTPLCTASLGATACPSASAGLLSHSVLAAL